MKNDNYGILEGWNNHRDHKKMSLIYEKEVPKISYDVGEALDEYVSETTGGQVRYRKDKMEMIKEGRISKYE